MLVRNHHRSARPGAVMVEAAVVLPILFLMILGLVVIGLGVFRYQQVAHLAREGARYASVRGADYQSDTAVAKADEAAVTTHIKSLAAGIDKSKLTCTVTWDQANGNPNYLSDPAANQYRINNVTVTVNYAWSPEALTGILGVTKNLTSVSTMPLSY